MIALNKNKAYRRFVNDRDKALERLLMSAQGKATQSLAEALQRVYDGIASRHLHMPPTEQLTVTGDHMTRSIGQLIDFSFSGAQAQVTEAIKQLRKRAKILTVASEKEALRRAGVKPKAAVKSKNVSTDMPTGGSIEARVALALSRIKTKILDAVQLSRVLGETTAEALERVRKTFPKLKRVTKPKKLAAIKEANRPHDASTPFDFDFINEDDWFQIEQEYLKPFQPRIRDAKLYFEVPEDKELKALGVDEGVWMGWEIENQITADFVDTVRKGQVQAANEQGITDFVWITLFGPTTCESCKWRNGLTSAEIEAKLENVDDDFDATVPPAHASCRCQLAPMIKELGEEPKDLGDFDTWLT